FRVRNLEETIKRIGQEYLLKSPSDSKFGRFALIKDIDRRTIYLTER
ncbi:glyoxalase/bleomycin resistance/extradiol dioxygenase family protein, partial [Candidatus Pacearchaeota archaeon]|nr:glyoxalase/bleomycin resistance/extradiol dioxygenase family protein [Candidatus Pacearchaeota archaeon]